MQLPEGLRNLFYGLTGTKWFTADETMLRALADVLDRTGMRLESELPPLITSTKRRVRSAFESKAADYFDSSIDRFTSGNTNYVKASADASHQLADFVREAANQVEYTKGMIIGQLIQLAMEIAWAIAMSKWTFGASLTMIPIFKRIASLAIQRLLNFLFNTLVTHLVVSVAFAMIMDQLIQRLQIAQGNRKGNDNDLSKAAGVGGVIDGVFSAGLSAFGNKFADWVTNNFDDLIKINMRNGGPEIPTPPVGSKNLDEVVGDTTPPPRNGYNNVPDGTPAPKEGGPDLTTGPSSGAGRNGDGTPGPDTPVPPPGRGADTPVPPPGRGSETPVPPPAPSGARDLPETAPPGAGSPPPPRVADDMAGVLSRNVKELIQPFQRNPRPAWDNVATMGRFRDDVGKVFADNFGDQIGRDAARNLGRDYADTFAANWGTRNIGDSLARVFDNAPSGPAGRLPSETTDFLSRNLPDATVDSLAQFANDWRRTAVHFGTNMGEGAASNVLGEGFSNLILEGEFKANGMSAVAGASNAAITTGGVLGGIKGLDALENLFKSNMGAVPPPPVMESDPMAATNDSKAPVGSGNAGGTGGTGGTGGGGGSGGPGRIGGSEDGDPSGATGSPETPERVDLPDTDDSPGNKDLPDTEAPARPAPPANVPSSPEVPAAAQGGEGPRDADAAATPPRTSVDAPAPPPRAETPADMGTDRGPVSPDRGPEPVPSGNGRDLPDTSDTGAPPPGVDDPSVSRRDDRADTPLGDDAPIDTPADVDASARAETPQDVNGPDAVRDHPSGAPIAGGGFTGAPPAATGASPAGQGGDAQGAPRPGAAAPRGDGAGPSDASRTPSGQRDASGAQDDPDASAENRPDEAPEPERAFVPEPGAAEQADGPVATPQPQPNPPVTESGDGAVEAPARPSDVPAPPSETAVEAPASGPRDESQASADITGADQGQETGASHRDTETPERSDAPRPSAMESRGAAPPPPVAAATPPPETGAPPARNGSRTGRESDASDASRGRDDARARTNGMEAGGERTDRAHTQDRSDPAPAPQPEQDPAQVRADQGKAPSVIRTFTDALQGGGRPDGDLADVPPSRPEGSPDPRPVTATPDAPSGPDKRPGAQRDPGRPTSTPGPVPAGRTARMDPDTAWRTASEALKALGFGALPPRPPRSVVPDPLGDSPLTAAPRGVRAAALKPADGLESQGGAPRATTPQTTGAGPARNPAPPSSGPPSGGTPPADATHTTSPESLAEDVAGLHVDDRPGDPAPRHTGLPGPHAQGTPSPTERRSFSRLYASTLDALPADALPLTVGVDTGNGRMHGDVRIHNRFFESKTITGDGPDGPSTVREVTLRVRFDRAPGVFPTTSRDARADFTRQVEALFNDQYLLPRSGEQLHVRVVQADLLTPPEDVHATVTWRPAPPAAQPPASTPAPDAHPKALGEFLRRLGLLDGDPVRSGDTSSTEPYVARRTLDRIDVMVRPRPPRRWSDPARDLPAQEHTGLAAPSEWENARNDAPLHVVGGPHLEADYADVLTDVWAARPLGPDDLDANGAPKDPSVVADIPGADPAGPQKFVRADMNSQYINWRRFEWRRIPLANPKPGGPTHVREITFRPRISPYAGMNDAAYAKYLQDYADTLDTMVNGKFRVRGDGGVDRVLDDGTTVRVQGPGADLITKLFGEGSRPDPGDKPVSGTTADPRAGTGDQLHIRLEFADDDTPADQVHADIAIHPWDWSKPYTDQSMNAELWYDGGYPVESRVHETLHWLGLLDEYADHASFRRQGPDADGVRPGTGLMGNSWLTAAGSVI
ncbi:hypothetical protein ACFOVU_07810, partial [Nocardiopsis sediminis]